LQYYGFVEIDNMNDIYDFGCTALEFVLRMTDQLPTELFPSKPAPDVRLKEIASSFQYNLLRSSENDRQIDELKVFYEL